MLNKTVFNLIIFAASSGSVLAQTPAANSLKTHNLEEVVTGQYEPQSVDKSVYKIRRIPMERILADATKWDIACTGFIYTTNFGPGTPSFPYYFQDMIIQNQSGGVATAVITATSTLTYESFKESDIANVTFVYNNQINIGSSWRTTGGPPPSPPAGISAVKFYIVQDTDLNVYKLQFTALTTSGERGKPQFKFDVVKKGT